MAQELDEKEGRASGADAVDHARGADHEGRDRSAEGDGRARSTEGDGRRLIAECSTRPLTPADLADVERFEQEEPEPEDTPTPDQPQANDTPGSDAKRVRPASAPVATTPKASTSAPCSAGTSLLDLPARAGLVVLASGSPRRVELLQEAGFLPEVAPQDVDETPRDGEDPVQLVARLAQMKARSALERGDADANDLVVAADTTVWFEGTDLGKPADAPDACRMLRALSGRTHHVTTGVCLELGGVEYAFTETTAVTFWDLSDADIVAYVASGEPLDKAGAYGIQGRGRMLVKSIDGDYFNVVGLPVSRLLREMATLLDNAGARTDDRAGARADGRTGAQADGRTDAQDSHLWHDGRKAAYTREESA